MGTAIGLHSWFLSKENDKASVAMSCAFESNALFQCKHYLTKREEQELLYGILYMSKSHLLSHTPHQKSKK